MRNTIPLLLLFLLAGINDTYAQDKGQKGVFVAAPQEEHNFLLVLAKRPGDFPEVRGEITKYIWKYYPNEHLKLTQIQVDGDLKNVPLILLQSFDDQAGAMDFYHSLKKNMPDFMQMGITVDYFAISVSNYNRIIRAQSLSGYKEFFEQEYLR